MKGKSELRYGKKIARLNQLIASELMSNLNTHMEPMRNDTQPRPRLKKGTPLGDLVMELGKALSSNIQNAWKSVALKIKRVGYGVHSLTSLKRFYYNNWGSSRSIPFASEEDKYLLDPIPLQKGTPLGDLVMELGKALSSNIENTWKGVALKIEQAGYGVHPLTNLKGFYYNNSDSSKSIPFTPEEDRHLLNLIPLCKTGKNKIAWGRIATILEMDGYPKRYGGTLRFRYQNYLCTMKPINYNRRYRKAVNVEAAREKDRPNEAEVYSSIHESSRTASKKILSTTAMCLIKLNEEAQSESLNEQVADLETSIESARMMKDLREDVESTAKNNQEEFEKLMIYIKTTADRLYHEICAGGLFFVQEKIKPDEATTMDFEMPKEAVEDYEHEPSPLVDYSSFFWNKAAQQRNESEELDCLLEQAPSNSGFEWQNS